MKRGAMIVGTAPVQRWLRPGGRLPAQESMRNPETEKGRNSRRASVTRRSGGNQRIDLRRRESRLGEDLDAVLAEPGRQAADLGSGAAESRRNVRHAESTLGRVIELLPETGRGQVRVLEKILDRSHRPVPDVRVLQQLRPVRIGAGQANLRQGG